MRTEQVELTVLCLIHKDGRYLLQICCLFPIGWILQADNAYGLQAVSCTLCRS